MGLHNVKILRLPKLQHEVFNGRERVCGIISARCQQPGIFHYSSCKRTYSLSEQREMTDPNSHQENEKNNRPFGPVIKKLDSAEFHSLFTPGLRFVQDLFNEHKFELSIAGGAVRDLMLGIKPKDVDFATTATPDEMLAIFREKDVRTINEGGHSHGTVTCRVHEENFEITTLRIDRVTDGRHAQVEFTKDWYLDASRRDLTVNSMFLDLQGNIVDFFNGGEDLINRRVRFVGDPAKRITEDYLRILRFFRFFGRIAHKEADFDAGAISAIKAHGHGLADISGPRIWTEMTQILTGNHIAKIMRKMYECGIFKYIGFPESADLDLFEKIYSKTMHLNANHMTYVSTLLRSEEDVLKLEERVQFSKNERKISLFIVKYRDKIDLCDPHRLKFCQDILVDIPPHEGCHRDYLVEVLKYVGDFETMASIKEWRVPRFPVSGKMLMAAGVPKGKTVGVVVKLLKERWKEGYFLLSADELLKEVPNILEGQ